VFFLSLSARKPVCKPLDEEGNDQNIPHGSVYFAGIAVYITLGALSKELRQHLSCKC
jgi:hypothetical protein